MSKRRRIVLTTYFVKMLSCVILLAVIFNMLLVLFPLEGLRDMLRAIFGVEFLDFYLFTRATYYILMFVISTLMVFCIFFHKKRLKRDAQHVLKFFDDGNLDTPGTLDKISKRIYGENATKTEKKKLRELINKNVNPIKNF